MLQQFLIFTLGELKITIGSSEISLVELAVTNCNIHGHIKLKNA
jgi:hypothetical protein